MVELLVQLLSPKEVKEVLDKLVTKPVIPDKTNFFFSIGKIRDGLLTSPVNFVDWKVNEVGSKSIQNNEGKYAITCGEFISKNEVKPELILYAATNKKVRATCIKRCEANLPLLTNSCSFFVFTGLYYVNSIIEADKFIILAVTDSVTSAVLTMILATDSMKIEVGKEYRFSGTITSKSLFSKSDADAVIIKAEPVDSVKNSKKLLSFFLYRNILAVMGW